VFRRAVEYLRVQEQIAMLKCAVELYGLPSEITSQRKVEMELQDGADMADVIGELKKQIPGLEGPVIVKGQNKLTPYFAFNVNGRFYFEDGGNLRIKKGDRIALLSVATGG
jgi:molybdopterin converting factor small subunit